MAASIPRVMRSFGSLATVADNLASNDSILDVEPVEVRNEAEGAHLPLRHTSVDLTNRAPQNVLHAQFTIVDSERSCGEAREAEIVSSIGALSEVSSFCSNGTHGASTSVCTTVDLSKFVSTKGSVDSPSAHHESFHVGSYLDRPSGELQSPRCEQVFFPASSHQSPCQADDRSADACLTGLRSGRTTLSEAERVHASVAEVLKRCKNSPRRSQRVHVCEDPNVLQVTDVDAVKVQANSEIEADSSASPAHISAVLKPCDAAAGARTRSVSSVGGIDPTGSDVVVLWPTPTAPTAPATALSSWSVDQVATWAASLPLPLEVSIRLRANAVNGPVFQSLTEQDLCSIGIALFGWRRQLLLSREELLVLQPSPTGPSPGTGNTSPSYACGPPWRSTADSCRRGPAPKFREAETLVRRPVCNAPLSFVARPFHSGGVSGSGACSPASPGFPTSPWSAMGSAVLPSKPRGNEIPAPLPRASGETPGRRVPYLPVQLSLAQQVTRRKSFPHGFTTVTRTSSPSPRGQRATSPSHHSGGVTPIFGQCPSTLCIGRTLAQDHDISATLLTEKALATTQASTPNPSSRGNRSPYPLHMRGPGERQTERVRLSISPVRMSSRVGNHVPVSSAAKYPRLLRSPRSERLRSDGKR